MQPTNLNREQILTHMSALLLDRQTRVLIGIVGKPGAGKSTLVKMIAGNFLPTHGKIAIDGREVVMRLAEGVPLPDEVVKHQ